MPQLFAVVAAVTPPGRLSGAVQSAVEFAATQPRVSPAQLNLADYTVSFTHGRALDHFSDTIASVVWLRCSSRHETARRGEEQMEPA